jgi:hypothetical protein
MHADLDRAGESQVLAHELDRDPCGGRRAVIPDGALKAERLEVGRSVAIDEPRGVVWNRGRGLRRVDVHGREDTPACRPLAGPERRVPVAHHSFGRWKARLFGDLHMYGPSAWASRGDTASALG